MNTNTKLSHNDAMRLKKIGGNAGKVLFSIFRVALLLVIGYIIIYPLFKMIVMSLQSEDAFFNSSRVWIPSDFAIIENYESAMYCLDYVKSLWITFKNMIVSAGIEIAMCAITAYGLARFNYKLKKFQIVMLFLTILIPEMLIIIPKTLNYSQLDVLGLLGLVDKLTGVDVRPNILNTALSFWLPSLFSVGLRSGVLIYIYIQFFKGLPKELEEAAWVDGAGPWRTFFSIAIPSSTVVIITVSILSLIWHWNDTLLPSMFLNDDSALSVMFMQIENLLFTKLGMIVSVKNLQALAIQNAGCILFIAPVLIFYMIVQRGFIESVDRVGITG